MQLCAGWVATCNVAQIFSPSDVKNSYTNVALYGEKRLRNTLDDSQKQAANVFVRNRFISCLDSPFTNLQALLESKLDYV